MTTIKKSTGHPTGLWVLFTTELWERFAFYAMRAILVLYLVSVSTGDTPGFGWSEADAYILYAWYTSLVYLSPIIGGWFADRFIGARMCVIIGAVLMALGQFALGATEFVRVGDIDVGLASDPAALWTFYTGLALMVLGNGFFKPCISTMVGELYEPGDDRRRDAGFMIFYMGINIGAFLSPILGGTVGEIYGYQYGFIIAGLGMVLGLVIFLVWGKHLKGIGDPPVKRNVTQEMTTETMTPEERAAHERAVYEQTRPLDKKDYDRMFVIFILAFFVIAFWLAFEQAGSSLNIFAKRHTDRTVAPVVQTVIPDGLLIRNEDFLDFRALVQKVQVLSDQVDRERKGIVAPSPTFAERLARYNPFRERQQDEFADLPFEEQIILVKEHAERLRVTLSASRYPAIQEAIEQLNRVIDNAIDSAIGSATSSADAALVEGMTDGITESHREAIVEAITTLLVGERGSYGGQIQIDLQSMDAAERRFDELQRTFNEQREEEEWAVLEQRTFPATWYQSGNPLIVVVFAPIFIFVWGLLARFGIEPSTPMKFAFGLLLMSAAFLVMIPGAIEAKYSGGRAAIYWLLLCFLLKTWGELCLSPIGLSMITKLSPRRYVSQFMGLWFCASSLSYFLAGYMASYYGSGEGINLIFGEEGGLADFFLLIAVIPAIFGIIALFLVPMLKRKMHGVH